MLEQNGEKRKVKLSLLTNFLIRAHYYLTNCLVVDIYNKYRQFNLIQAQWKHFQLKICRSVINYIFSLRYLL